MHFYDDNDAWEFYDLEKDPQEMHNAIADSLYAGTIATMHQKLDSIQKVYGVTEREFQQASRESVEKAYDNFKRLRGN
jgi:hypothetical protein